MKKWTVRDSLELYNIENWGRDLFAVDEDGDLLLTPRGPGGGQIDLYALTRELTERGVKLPVLLRFTDVLESRIDALASAFQTAIREYEYEGCYRGVYPIKVNQQRPLVQDLVRFGRRHHLGLEAGSKPELLIVLALLDDPDALIVCNGYKDRDYIEAALLAQKLNRTPFLVVERFSELDLIVEVAERLGVRPHIGLRAKLSRPGRGRWKTSSGDHAKFGLTVQGLVRAVRRLEERGYLDCLELLHFHIGSQVTAIRPFKNAVREAARVYTELVRMGAPMGYFDVGGGLGVDYDGSRSDFQSSRNYSDQEYAYDIVAGIEAACERAGVDHPHIITESGRSMVAHHAALIFDVLGVERFPTDGDAEGVSEADPEPLRELHEVYTAVSRENYQEAWHDALALKENGLAAFNLGLLSLEERARLDKLFWQVCGRIRAIVRTLDYAPEELQGLERALADTYYCNFSIFQSIPDSWAIGQLFPCAPIHRLDERPTRRAVLADITCDSDGKLDRFIDLRDVKDVLELHDWSGAPYLLGVFLVGAYQEILGDLHNLFGDTHSVHVSTLPGGGYRIDHLLEGDTISEVLSYVQYDKRDLVERVRVASEAALQEGRISLAEARTLIANYQRGLEGYTYLEGEGESRWAVSERRTKQA